MTLYITGATGFIGSHFVHAALAAGHEVIGLRFPGTKPVIPIPDSNRLAWFEGDLNSFLLAAGERKEGSRSQAENGDLQSPISDLQSSNAEAALVHLAAAGVNPKHATWDLCFEVNLSQSLQVWRRAVALGIKRFIICGSCFEYGLSAERYDFIPVTAPLEPTGPYHASKAAATMAAFALGIEHKLELAILRPFHVFGEGEGPDRFWPSLCKAALAGEDFPMSPGEQVRDFVPVEQVAQSFLRALDLPLEAFQSSSSHAVTPVVANIGTGQPQTLRAFAEHWWKKLEAKGELKLGALPYRKDETMRYVPSLEVKNL